MATNKHAQIRYNTLDKCFRNPGRNYTLEDLLEECNQAIYDFDPDSEGIKRRQLYDDLRFMESESGWNIELGNRGLFLDGRMDYDLSLYTIILRDLLVTERLAEGIFTGINAGEAMNSGLELLLHGSLFPLRSESPYNAGITLAYNISRNVFRNFVDDGIDYGGNMLPGIPVQELYTGIHGEYKDFSLKLNYRYTGDQWMTDANDLKYSGYQLVHLYLNWERKIANSPVSLNIFLGVKNLFNVHYASMILINAPSFGGRAPRYYYPGMPRQLQLGIRVMFHQ